MPLISLWTKARRAQNEEDFETWIAGGVSPTLNAFDNATETRATVLILAVDIYNASTDATNFHTIKATEGITAMPSVLIIDGTRVGDVRVYEDEVMQTVIQRWGTGGGNVPAILFDTQFGSNANTFEDVSPTLKASQQAPSIQENISVRRLTPTECERLQGFPDGWTAGQADSNRYKQMGNAVAVPVVQWIINNVVGE